MRVTLLIPAGFLAGAVLCRVLLHGAPARISTDLAQPLAVVTYWHGFGGRMWLALALALTIAAIGYIAALRSPPRIAQTTILSALACLAALAFPVIFSSDVYAYAGYGDMLRHGIDPYAHVRILVHDPLLDAMVWQWGNPPPMCVYGPVFAGLAEGIVGAFARFGPAAPLWFLRLSACGSLVACAPLAFAAFAPFSTRIRAAAAAGIALNPVVIWSCAEGHNDAMVVAIVLAGFVVLARRPFAGALIVALSALIKAPGLVPALGAAAFAWPDRPRFRRVACGAAAGTAVVAAIALPLENGVRTHLVPGGSYAPQFSLQYALGSAMPLTAAIAVTAVIALVLFVIGARALVQGRAGGALPIAAAAWLAVPNPYPWYALWIVPAAFLAWDTPLAWALIAASLTIAARYYGDATSVLSPAANLAIVACELGIPAAIFFLCTRRARRGRPAAHTPAPDLAPSRFA